MIERLIGGSPNTAADATRLTIHSPSSLTSVMVYSMPPGAMRYAYSVMSVVLMMRRRWLAVLKCGS